MAEQSSNVERENRIAILERFLNDQTRVERTRLINDNTIAIHALLWRVIDSRSDEESKNRQLEIGLLLLEENLNMLKALLVQPVQGYPEWLNTNNGNGHQ